MPEKRIARTLKLSPVSVKKKKKSIKERRMKRHVFRLQRAKAKYALAMTYNCSI